jgi:hypothetical protein
MRAVSWVAKAPVRVPKILWLGGMSKRTVIDEASFVSCVDVRAGQKSAYWFSLAFTMQSSSPRTIACNSERRQYLSQLELRMGRQSPENRERTSSVALSS